MTLTIVDISVINWSALSWKLVEVAPTEELFENPIHPYTNHYCQQFLHRIQERKNKVLVPFDGTSFTGQGEMKEISPEHFVLL